MSSNADAIFQYGDCLLQPKEAVASFVRRMTTGIKPRTFPAEQREEPRYTLSAIIELQPIDENLQPSGEIFQAVSRDISITGIGLTHNRAIDSDLLAVQLTNAEGDQLQTVIQVLRSQPFESTWDIGGRFVTAE